MENSEHEDSHPCYFCRDPATFSEERGLFVHEECAKQLDAHFHLWTPAQNDRPYPTAYFRRTSWFSDIGEGIDVAESRGIPPDQYLILECDCGRRI